MHHGAQYALQVHKKLRGPEGSSVPLNISQWSSHKTRLTDRKWCIWAHCAIAATRYPMKRHRTVSIQHLSKLVSVSKPYFHTRTVLCRAARHRTFYIMWPYISYICCLLRCRLFGHRARWAQWSGKSIECIMKVLHWTRLVFAYPLWRSGSLILH